VLYSNHCGRQSPSDRRLAANNSFEPKTNRCAIVFGLIQAVGVLEECGGFVYGFNSNNANLHYDGEGRAARMPEICHIRAAVNVKVPLAACF
jgi:hypothetical protein